MSQELIQLLYLYQKDTLAHLLRFFRTDFVVAICETSPVVLALCMQKYVFGARLHDAARAIRIAYRADAQQTVKALLLRHNFQPEPYLFRWAFRDKKEWMVELLADAAPVPPDTRDYALVRACRIGNIKLVEKMHARSSYGARKQGLIFAIAANNFDIVKFIFQRDDLRTFDRDTPMFCALWNGRTEILLYILSSPRVNPMNRDGLALGFAMVQDEYLPWHLRAAQAFVMDERVPVWQCVYLIEKMQATPEMTKFVFENKFNWKKLLKRVAY